MFKIPIKGEIDGRNITIYLNKRYKIITNNKEYEGTLMKCDEKDEKFLIKTVEVGYWIPFLDIIGMEEFCNA